MTRENRTPSPSRGPGRRITNEEVTPALVPDRLDPDDETSRDRVARFAHTFNGYAHGGGPTRLGPIVVQMRSTWEDHGDLPPGLSDLRAALFYWYRADRHAGSGGPRDVDDVAWINALLAAIRAAVSPH